MENELMAVEEVAKVGGNAKKFLLIGGAVVVLGIATALLVKKIRNRKEVKLLTEGDAQANSEEESN